jgi:anti-anti-sigma regulatory factor
MGSVLQRKTACSVAGKERLVTTFGITVRGLRDAFAGGLLHLGGGARRSVKPRESFTVFAPHADLTDGRLVWRLFEQCMTALDRAPREIVIDARNVTHADTKLAACLVALYQMARARNVHIAMRLSEPILRILELCRLDDLQRRTSPSA